MHAMITAILTYQQGHIYDMNNIIFANKPRPFPSPTILAVCISAVVALSAPTVIAQETINTANSAVHEAIRSYRIPAQPLSEALIQFGQQSGLQVTANSGMVEGKKSSPVNGNMSADQALSQLLATTDLNYQINGGMVSLVASGGTATLPSVKISADSIESAYGPTQGFVATTSATATKTDIPISEAPQSISVVTRDHMDNIGARSLADALKYNAGVTTGLRGESSGLSDDNIVIRGFGGTGTSNEYWDGLRMYGTNYANNGIDPYLFERIEVLRGPSSVLYGQNQPGGVVNSVSKRPQFTPQGNIQVLGGTFDTKELDADVSGPLNEHFAYRLVGVVSDQDGQTDFSGRERKVLLPSLTWSPSENTTLTLQSVYQKDDATGGVVRSLPAMGTIEPSPHGKVPKERFTGDPNYDKWDRELLSFGYFLEHNFNESWTARQNLRFLQAEMDMELVYAASLAEDNRTISRRAFGVKEDSDTLSIDNQLEGHFAIGEVKHTLLLGVDFQDRNASTLRRFANAPTLDLYSPVYYQDIPLPPVFQNIDEEQSRLGFYLQDQIKLQQWILTLGGRYDDNESQSTNNLNNVITEAKDDMLTGRIGLGYAFSQGFTPYISYAQSFEPQAGTDFFGNAFEPTEGEQWEGGIKYAPSEHNAFITLSVFELTQQNVTTADLEHPGSRIQTGEIRSRGIELESVASLENGWNFVASYTYLDQEVTQSNESNLGKRLATIPENKFTLWSDYSFNDQFSGLKAGAGVTYTGKTKGDVLNTFDVDAYTLLDASLEYDLSSKANTLNGWNISLNAKNLTDKTYVASCNSTIQCYYGLGRTFTVRVKHEW